MSFGLLGAAKLSIGLTEFEVYQAPSFKKAVGTIVVSSSHESLDRRVTLFLTSATGSVSGMLATALTDMTSEYGFIMIGGLCKFFGSDDGIPLTISGVVIGPQQRLIAFDNDSGTLTSGESLHVLFSGIEEDV